MVQTMELVSLCLFLLSFFYKAECYPRDVWHQVDGRCYYISQTEMNFSEGKIKCQNLVVFAVQAGTLLSLTTWTN
ncbi:hypothetical protein RRG08_032946 [Elysia crispata]|uniref:Uncharacterized protein n=1 Tax=Elysia crispata TaxID=231223 RepID=A0AAE0Z7P2_9GAST|nr:hypothetical protein RRG08_032946 [Elysia crispata]